MFNEQELVFPCPYCGEQISFLVEELFGNQKYIEDCEVCCRPIQMSYQTSQGKIENFQVERID